MGNSIDKVRPMIALADDKTLEAKNGLRKKIRIARSILSTAPGASSLSHWTRGSHVITCDPSRKWIEIELSYDDRLPIFNTTSKLETMTDWEAANDIAIDVERWINTLYTQNPRESFNRLPRSLLKIRDVLSAAATARGFVSYDLLIEAPCRNQKASCCVYHNGPEPWRLSPDVETTLLNALPEMATIGFDKDLTIEPVILEETPNDNIMSLMRAIANENFPSGSLELKRSW